MLEGFMVTMIGPLKCVKGKKQKVKSGEIELMV